MTTTEAALRDALAEVFADCHKISSAEWYNKAAAALSHPSPASSTDREALKAAYIQGATDVHTEWLRAHDAGEAPPRGDPEFDEAAGDYADAASPSPSSGEPAQTDDPLQSYEKFDGVGPHSETVETRAMIGERFLECYESALDDPLLKGYVPADCPSEIVLNLLERLREAGEPASVAVEAE